MIVSEVIISKSSSKHKVRTILYVGFAIFLREIKDTHPSPSLPMFPRVSPRGRKPAAAAAAATYDDGLPDADSLRKAQQGAADDDPDGPIIGPDGEGVSSVVVGSSSFSLEAEALERAMRDSVRTSVGAYSVVPG